MQPRPATSNTPTTRRVAATIAFPTASTVDDREHARDQRESVRVITPAVPPILTTQVARALTRIIANVAGDPAVDIADAVRPQAIAS